ncbi:hypothetical protein AGABI2DRAFT_186233 [Agaricus bisporus var. bisporus H97]|uniref:hypothetical protein n=1 Tax=Agaricus bisporus var. bisporus (strain H97 / ATCC MYA-4626 / FGSC 10389) TaxID=936046 RepID=UPI00029F6855|nr:hypothetical protein AGABI2DRAFT_186233 [Agaricus bisporus var. bisporus H97]EKV46900.1 hypothetical protein AGABI2DRAFT_186233 [Agaricus bisporus var. bisporus H97]
MTMTSIHATDEETPLLQDQPRKKTPLPWFQLWLVILLQMGESMTAQVISPFAPQLIRDLGVAGGDETKVGYYVGMMYSVFFLTEACTVLHWSQLSDKIGRKPAILIGTFGLSISMYYFGLSTTFLGVIFSRASNGALNGNIAVMKSMVTELTDSTNIAQAFAYNSLAWASGATLGPFIGGLLARPAERFPSIFGDNAFLKKHPYFLPCAVPATYSACAWLIAYLFLKETVQQPISIRELVFKSANKSRPSTNPDTIITENTNRPLPLKSLLVTRVVVAGFNYVFLSLVDISFRVVQPLFLSTPIALGGLGLPPSTIGSILSFFGIIHGIFQVFFFARINDRWGPKRVFLAGIGVGIPLYLFFPAINYLASTQGLTPVVWATVFVQATLSIPLNCAYGAIFIFIAAATPNKASVGATNGLCQVAVCVARGLGPGIVSSLFSLSIAHGWFGGYFVYYIFVMVVGVALFVGSKLPHSL